MFRSLVIAALLVVAVGVADAQAGWRRSGRYYYYPAAPAAAPAAAASPAPAPMAQGMQRRYSYAPTNATVWPYYPNIGNPEGTAYSPAAAMRPGQVYGTFGLRPADARARGNY